MVINKNSWHYKAYTYSYKMWQNDIPYNTSLCSYMRDIFLLPASGIFLILALALGWILFALVITVHTVGAFLIGFRPAGWDLSILPYSGLKVSHMEIYPWHIILLGLLLWALPKLFLVNAWVTTLVVLGFAGLIFGAVELWHSDSFLIFRAWLTAKKEGVCPMIDFEDK